MKRATIISILIILVVAGVCWSVTSWQRRRTITFVSKPTLQSFINVHGARREYLRICGRTFHEILGAPPYYLSISNTDLIAFAYQSTRSSRNLVLCDTNDCTFYEVPLAGINFGDGIGYWEPTNGKMGDIVEAVSSNRVFLLSKSLKYMEHSILDLESKTVRVIELQDERSINLSTLTNQF